MTAENILTIALQGDGRLCGWGNIENGQLDDETTTSNNAPVQISNQANVVDLMTTSSVNHAGIISATRNSFYALS